MPFCTQCGNQVRPVDIFCAGCGARQAVAPPPSGSDFLRDLSPRTASMLCYIPFLGWVAAIIILATPRFREERTVRFNAFQGLYLFVVWLLIDAVAFPFMRSIPGHTPMQAVSGILHAVVIGAWIWMIVKTAQEQLYHLPIIGELAERSLAEQR